MLKYRFFLFVNFVINLSVDQETKKKCVVRAKIPGYPIKMVDP